MTSGQGSIKAAPAINCQYHVHSAKSYNESLWISILFIEPTYAIWAYCMVDSYALLPVCLSEIIITSRISVRGKAEKNSCLRFPDQPLKKGLTQKKLQKRSTKILYFFLAHLCILYGGLIYVTFCLYVCHA